jgi:DNA-binding NarL/FixJ family response regulator
VAAEAGSRLRVLLADDNPLVRLGLSNLLETCPEIAVVGVASNGREAVELATRALPDVVLLDVRMPEVDGIAAAAALSPRTAVLMLTHSDSPDVVSAALRAGARGYVVHTEIEVEELIVAIRTVARGGTYLSPTAGSAVTDYILAGGAGQGAGPPGGDGRPPPGGPALPPVAGAHDLSPREVEVMGLVAQGLTNRQIAAQYFLSEKTVKNHINRIFAKLAVASRAEAVSLWLRPGGQAGRRDRGAAPSSSDGP